MLKREKKKRWKRVDVTFCRVLEMDRGVMAFEITRKAIAIHYRLNTNIGRASFPRNNERSGYK